MDMLFLISLISIAAGAWFVWASRRLTEEEVEHLARVKRICALEEHYGFIAPESHADLSFKSNMKASGRLYDLDESLREFPSLAAALLKGKKHEWVIFGLCRGDRVLAAWMNKGPSRERVWPLVSKDTLFDAARELGASIILDIHNHPNPNPSKWSVSRPSPQDKMHAEIYGKFFVNKDMSYLAFVTERGRHFQYGCWVPDHHFPLKGVLSDIRARNGTSRFANFRLRREAKAPSRLALLLQDPNATENAGLKTTIVTTRSSHVPKVGPLPKKGKERTRQTLPPPTPSGDHQFTRVPVVSSHIGAVGYDFHAKILQVTFKDGAIYRYFAVPEHEYQELLRAPSKGRYLNTQILRQGYSYKRVN